MRGTANLLKGSKREKRRSPIAAKRGKGTVRRLMNAGWREEKKTERVEKKIPGTSQRKETFLSERFKWKLSQVKHKVNQMNLMPLASFNQRHLHA